MSSRFVTAAMATLVVFVASLVWLILTWKHGNRTYGWTETPAIVVDRDVDRSVSRTRIYGWATTVQYDVGGQQYEKVVNEYFADNQVKVYVNPINPAEVVASQGPLLQHMAAPVLLTIGSGIFGILLVLIRLSPDRHG